MKTCIQNQNTNHNCYTFPKVMPASQSSQAVPAVWNGEGKTDTQRFPSQLVKRLYLPLMLLSQAQAQVIFQHTDLKTASHF